MLPPASGFKFWEKWNRIVENVTNIEMWQLVWLHASVLLDRLPPLSALNMNIDFKDSTFIEVHGNYVCVFITHATLKTDIYDSVNTKAE